MHVAVADFPETGRNMGRCRVFDRDTACGAFGNLFNTLQECLNVFGPPFHEARSGAILAIDAAHQR
jgi:hypothetical protein